MSNYEMGTLVIQGIGIIGAFITAYFIHLQVKNMAASLATGVEANKTSNLMMVLQLEEAISSSRANFSEALMKSKELDESSASHEEKKIAAKFALLLVEERKEQYLNSLDRLCTCIIREYIDENQYQEDFRDTLKEVIKEYPNLFGASSRHHNIITVNDAWKKGETARKSKRS